MNEEKRTLPRYRTVRECFEEIKRLDEQTVISEYFIRQLCKSGQVKCYHSGNKTYVNLDSLFDYLNNEPP